MPFFCSTPAVQMANGAATDYRIFVVASTEYFAVENPAGELHVCRANRPQVIPACQAIAFWPCDGAFDPTPTGEITALDCHGIALTALDIRRLAALKTLDCSENQLAELDLSGAIALENLYCQGNLLAALALSPCSGLSFLRCSSDRLGSLGSIDTHSPLSLNDLPLCFIPPGRSAGLVSTINHTLCAAKYISPRIRTLTSEEATVRNTAYALKKSAPEAIAVAASAMAALISGPCWLVPIPASNTSLDANLVLARAIAAFVPGARVKIAVARTQSVPSSTKRRRKHLSGLQPDEHHIVRIGGPLNPLPLFFVDNVITTGNTIRAARAALGWGTGLAYADASTPFNNRLKQSTASRPAQRRSVQSAYQSGL